MLSISSTFPARFSGKSALQLLQTASLDVGGSNQNGASVRSDVNAVSENGGAIDSIMRIILDAKGNASVLINSPDGIVSATTGEGNDVIDIIAGRINYVSTHGGDDAISIRAAGSGESDSIFNPAVYSVDAGDGNDSIDIDSRGSVFSTNGGNGDDKITIVTTAPLRGRPDSIENLFEGIYSTDGGNGDDTISLESSTSVNSTYGGNGNDTISVVAAAYAMNTDGGNGDDIIRVASRDVFNVDGGKGNDAIHVASRLVSNVDGGSGDDVIEVAGLNIVNVTAGDGNDIISASSAAALYNVSGGKGDDYVILNGSSSVQSTYYFAEGDGHDTIETNNPLEILPNGSDGTRRGDMMNAIIEKQGNTLKIAFANNTDTITINLTGRMAEAKNIRFTYNHNTQSLLIADDRFFVDNPSGQTVFLRPDATK
ncbi:hypothetical protein HFO45_07200 [Rhizobium leguminosarum]|uniref:hypothetical protein n=1 Tax=Rhizobium TaxID=379 RepID=UPI001C9007A2|nr:MULTISPECIES: hypothetical protein [Rhizobium]MBY3117871.1 hypothetical protein [Rhizobium laguerreae]MBY3188286.1 hypothetical protein [Rhizobium laguerreae]MBY5648043.1 hypothetical protein [Rhizobium leguminosarum]